MAWIIDIGVQKYLTEDQRKNNAIEFRNYFMALGFTIESICGMLGNIQRESGLNPGNKQTSSTSSGWGLIQWTPSTVLTIWANNKSYNWYDGYAQCRRIDAEGNNEKGATGYWLSGQGYSYTWNEFSQLTDIQEATKAYLYQRERAGVEALELRLQYANEWYTFFTGEEPPQPVPPSPPISKKNKMPLYMYMRRL